MGDDNEQRVELSIPATVEWLALARTTGAAIAARWSFTYDEIADLRLAIDELCLTLVEGVPAERLELVYCLDEEALSVKGHAVGLAQDGDVVSNLPGIEPALSSDLSARILDALVDEHGSDGDDKSRRAWLRKRRTPQDA